ncbi:MAG TPA: cytochrome C [Geobacteraceae bacterium]|nr:cytochrome C [Geobacteraceae bacterium]
MRISGKDWLFIALMGSVLLIFILISGEEKTSKIPYDDAHRPFYETLEKTGSKREAEKGCEKCHNDGNIPFPKDHPPKNRCLFCHKMQQVRQ